MKNNSQLIISILLILSFSSISFIAEAKPRVVNVKSLQNISAGVEIGTLLNFKVTTKNIWNIQKVRMYLDGKFITVDKRPPYKLSLDTANLARGTKVLTFKVLSGKTTIVTSEAIISFELTPKKGAPSIKVISGQDLSSQIDIGTKLYFNVIPNNINTTKVKVFLDDKWFSVDKKSPYKLTIDTALLSSGLHSIYFKVVDNNNVTYVSKTSAFKLLDASAKCGPISNTPLVYLSDFESGKIQDKSKNYDGWLDQSVKKPYSINVVTKGQMGTPKVRNGRKAVRFEYRPGDYPLKLDAPKKRERVQLRGVKAIVKNGVDNWVGFSLYLPRNFDTTYTKNKVKLFQLYGKRPFLKVGLKNDLWIANGRSGKQYVNTSYGSKWKSVKGKWVDVIIFVHPSLSPNKGKLKIWMDGKEYINYTGVFGDGQSMNFMLDIYSATNVKRVAWFDDVRVSLDKDGYDKVNPQCYK